MVSNLVTESRRHYYNFDECHRKYPDKTNPEGHTMGKDNFLKYIGRLDPVTKERMKGNEILGKKFSDAQKEYLKRAYQNANSVRVIGAEKTDIGFLLDSFSRKELNGKENKREVLLHQSKRFNNLRATMVWTVNCQPECEQKTELWVIVFPSPQYVDQFGELIQAIYDDFKLMKVDGGTEVEIWNFDRLEKEVAKWTGLDSCLSQFVRHGDVAAIGNVDLLLQGIQSVGYHPKFSDWRKFGLNDMFGIQILVNDASFSRIILLGIAECFWGEASARYVESLLRAGVRHILYGSKAASMKSRSDIKTIKSPGSFSIYVRHRGNQGLTPLNSTLTANESLRQLAELAGIETAGIGVTVPTVIGEDQDQRTRLINLNPSTMDDEDGYIAQVVQAHNRKFEGTLEPAGFLPVHYISDYIHKPDETAEANQTNLAVTETSDRNEKFLKIGRFFGVYTNIYGLREYVFIPKGISNSHFNGPTVEDLLKRVRSFLNAGMVREAISSLAGSTRVMQLPSCNLQTIAMICQKYGFVDDAINVLEEIRQDKTWTTLPVHDRIRLQIIEVKLHTQSGRFLEAEKEIDTIFNTYDLNTLSCNELYRSLCRRKALTIAVKNYNIESPEEKIINWEKAVGLFEEANKVIQVENRGTFAVNSHEEATNKLFYYIAFLASGAPLTEDWDKDFSTIRRKYLNSLTENLVWTTNPEKSALTLLFIEAALRFVSRGIEDPGGMIRLAIAHLYNIKIGGSERSEGYGELIAFIQDESLKDLFRRAMRIDGNGRRDFQRATSYSHYCTHIQQCMDIFNHPIVQRGENLDDLLTKLDDKFGL